MIVALIVFLLVVVFMAFFFGKNLTNSCNFWFFKGFENVPVSVLVLISFAVGIVFCILVFIIAKIRKAAIDESTVSPKDKTKKDKTSKVKEQIDKKERKFRKNKKDAVVPPANSVTVGDNKSDNK